ncbi:MAG TPA: hypothetical protein V6C81_02280 [Planktothrix sp.]|jgi:hypothetical protein
MKFHELLSQSGILMPRRSRAEVQAALSSRGEQKRFFLILKGQPHSGLMFAPAVQALLR